MSNESTEYRVLGCLGGLYELENARGARLFCRARGAFRHADTRVLVGDLVRVAGEGEDVAIEEILPRKNALIRPRMANLDVLVAVTAVKEPSPVFDTLDKLLAICAHSGIECAVVLSKCDLAADAEIAVLADVYERAGYPVFALSTQMERGVDAFENYLDTVLTGGRTVAFAGASGVGKSTLLNAVFEGISRETGSVSEKIGRGRHTTRDVHLFEGRGGFVADTPGFSMLDFLRFDFFSLEELPATFPEVDRLAHECRYADCTHRREEECAVREAVRLGEIAETRYASYCALYDVLKEKKKKAYK